MPVRNDLAGEPNDVLLTRLLHVAAVCPVYKWKMPARRHLAPESATVYVEQEFWPLPADQAQALTEWAAEKCSVTTVRVTLLPVSQLPAAPEETEDPDD
jgi:hypothetical protein